MLTLHLMDICFNDQCSDYFFTFTKFSSRSDQHMSHYTCTCAAAHFALLVFALWTLFMHKLHL